MADKKIPPFFFEKCFLFVGVDCVLEKSFINFKIEEKGSMIVSSFNGDRNLILFPSVYIYLH